MAALRQRGLPGIHSRAEGCNEDAEVNLRPTPPNRMTAWGVFCYDATGLYPAEVYFWTYPEYAGKMFHAFVPCTLHVNEGFGAVSSR